MVPRSQPILKQLFLSSLIALCAAAYSYADQLVFPNGETLTGTIVKEEGGIVTFKSPYLGTIHAKESETTVIKDASTPPTLSTLDADLAEAETPTAPSKDTSKEASAAEAATEASPPADDNKSKPWWKRWKKPDNWSGKATVGISERWGEKDTEDINLAAELEIKKPRKSYKWGAYYDYGEQDGEKNTDMYGAEYRYRYDLTERTFLQAMTIYTHDGIKEIRHRLTQSIGYGYTVIKNDKMELNLVPGVAVQYLDQEGEAEGFTFMLNPYQDFKWYITEGIKLTESFDSFFDVKNGSNYNFVFKIGIETIIKEPYIMSITYRLDYDNSVAKDIRKDDSRLVIGLGYIF